MVRGERMSDLEPDDWLPPGEKEEAVELWVTRPIQLALQTMAAERAKWKPGLSPLAAWGCGLAAIPTWIWGDSAHATLLTVFAVIAGGIALEKKGRADATTEAIAALEYRLTRHGARISWSGRNHPLEPTVAWPSLHERAVASWKATLLAEPSWDEFDI